MATNANHVRVILSADAARLKRDMVSAQSIVKSSASAMSSALGALGVSFGAVQGARFLKGIIDDADAMSKLSQKTNMAVEQVAGWSHALDLAGVSQEALQKTAKALGTQMLDASMGLLEAKRNFAALDIDIKNNDGSLKSVNAVLLEVADRYANATDKTAAAALMNKVLGKSALDLIPAFKEGRAALEAQIEEGKRYNPITEESAHQAEVFNDNVQRLSKSIKSGFIVSMNEALPRMAAISEEFVRNANEGSKLLAILKAVAQGLNWSDPALVAQQKEMIALAERREAINSNIERLRAKGPQWAEPVAREMAELAKLDARAKALSAMINPVDPRNYDARDLALVGNKPAFTPNISGTTGAAKNASHWTDRDEQLYRMRVQAMKEIDATKQQLADAEKVRDDRIYADRVAAAIELKTHQEAIARSAKQIWEETRTPAEQFNAHIQRLNVLLREGAIDFDTYERAGGLAMERLVEKTKTAADEMTEFWRSAAQNMQSSMGEFFFDAMQGNLSDLAGSFKKTVDRMVANALAAKAATALFGPAFGTDANAPIGGLIGKVLGSFATGTSYVPKTGPYMLHQGEKVVPAAENAASSIVVNQAFNITGPIDNRSRQQIEAAALSGAQRALARNT